MNNYGLLHHDVQILSANDCSFGAHPLSTEGMRGCQNTKAFVSLVSMYPWLPLAQWLNTSDYIPPHLHDLPAALAQDSDNTNTQPVKCVSSLLMGHSKLGMMYRYVCFPTSQSTAQLIDINIEFY